MARFGIILLLTLFLGTYSWAANSLSEAEDAMAEAYNNYFEAIRAGKASTSQQMADLRKLYLDPAAAELGKKFNESQNQIVQQGFQSVIDKKKMPKLNKDTGEEDGPRNLTEENLSKEVEKLVGKGKGGKFKLDKKKSKNLAKKEDSPTNDEEDTQPAAQPEVVLDGSNIPREIEFKKATKLDKLMHPENYRVPAAVPSHPDENVDEIQFPAKKTF